MKICLINNLYKPYNRGGAETIVEGMARNFTESGHNVFIITTKPRLNGRKNFDDDRQKSIDVFMVYYLSSFYYNLIILPKFLRIFWHLFDMFDVFTAIKVKNILEKEKPNIVITHNLKGVSFLVPFFIKKLDIKLVHILHDVQLYYPSGIILFSKERKTATLAARIYCCWSRYFFKNVTQVVSPSSWLMTEHTKRGFFKNCRKNIFPIGFFALPNHIKESHNYMSDDKLIVKKFSFLFIGQLEEHKGIIFLINGFNKFCQLYPDREVELVVVGSGSLIKKAKNLANISVNFRGKLLFAEIAKIIATSHCLIIPSHCYENSPTEIFRAVLYKLPVLAADLGGMKETINYYGGVLFNPGDSEDLTDKMDWVISHYGQVKKRAASQSANAQKFFDSNLTSKFLKLLQ